METQFHDGWQEWLAFNMIRNVSEAKILDVLVSNGFEEDFSRQQITSMKSHPVFVAGQKTYREKNKLSSLIETLGKLLEQSGQVEQIDIVSDITPSEFYSNYFFANRPVVVKGLTKDWEALKKWSPAFFKQEFGNEEIEITAGRNKDPKYEDNFRKHRHIIKMGEFIDMLDQETNDVYLVAKNNLLLRKPFAGLKNDFSFPQGFLNPNFRGTNYVKLWLGPKGTVTPLHHDAGNIFFVQIYGKKHIKLIPPYYIEKLYNDRNCFSAVHLEDIDYKRFPLMSRVKVLDVVIEPGDFVLLPVCWWHWVKSLDVSISISMQNFYYKDEIIVWK